MSVFEEAIRIIYSRIWAFFFLVLKFWKQYKLALLYWRVQYGLKHHWEIRLNDSAIVSAYRYNEYHHSTDEVVYFFCWKFLEPLNVRKAELLYKGRVIKSVDYNHCVHPGEVIRLTWTFNGIR